MIKINKNKDTLKNKIRIFGLRSNTYLFPNHGSLQSLTGAWQQQFKRPTKILDWDKYETARQKKKWHRGTEGLKGIAGNMNRTGQKKTWFCKIRAAEPNSVAGIF